MTQQPSADQLKGIIAQTFSPDANIRRAAESQLAEAQKSPGHALAVLRLVASSDAADAVVRQAAAVHFKNLVKNGWDVNREDGTNGIQISEEDRVLIKDHLVELMCTMPPQIKAQCSEAISLIAAVDFPAKWDNLLPALVKKFNSPDPAVVDGVLQTANSIFKRFRYVQKSDALFADILYSLKHIEAPLLTLFKTTGQAVEAYKNDPTQLKLLFSMLRSMCRIFYSLNYQDLPEYFEDHMSEWMDEFAKYLQYQNPVLVDNNEEDEPSPVDKLQAAIIENLKLYADKDEEPFLPFLPNFASLVWNLLINVTALPKHDVLATTSIRFLSSLVQKLMHKPLFQEEATLRQIISKIVIPNLMIREVDEERFEDDPQEFIRVDIEGSESDSRRKCSQELLRAMCRQFEEQATAICSEHVASMYSEYGKDPASNWKAKDVAILTTMGIAIRAETTAQGVSQINDKVDVMDFFTKHILPELQDTNHSVRPMVKATAIKFVSTFRNQFSREQLTALMPLLIAHLGSPSVVVHTYAAYAIEKILTTKEEQNGVKKAKFGSANLKPFLEPLFTALFLIIDSAEWNENEYAMKCVMRSLSVANQDIVGVTQVVLEKLTSALARVAKNPRNPQYNHYMFESIAVLIRSVCSMDPSTTNSFEQLLFPPFQTVLQMEIAEFTPYVFQLLAQILEYRPQNSGLGEAYTMLFRPLLTPSLWDLRGNVPALTRLISAYLAQAASELVAAGHLLGVLGVFQKLIASRANEVCGFDLLSSLVLYVPREALQPHFKTIFQLLLTRLQQGRPPRFVRLITNFFALFVGKYGPELFLTELNNVQPGLGLMLISSVWLPRLHDDPPSRLDAKLQVVGLTKLLCNTPELLNDANGQKVWAQVLASTVAIIASPSSHLGSGGDTDDDPAGVEIGYDATFSSLHFAKRPARDPFPDIADPSLFFVQSLHALCSSQQQVQSLIQQGLQADPKLAASLATMFQKAGLSL